MNRIRSRTFSGKPFSSEASVSEMMDFTSGMEAATQGHIGAVAATAARIASPHYALFAPLHYEPNYAYPLLVWLHAAGDDENQLKRVMPQISLRNYVAIAPRGTCSEGDDNERFTWRQTEPHIAAAEQRVLDCLSVAKEKFNLAPARIFLAGHDAGGTMAFRVALRHPQLFAGVVSCGGPLPTGNAPLAHLHAARRLSVFLGCSRRSQRYPTSLVCDDLRLLHSAGM